jgi:hypothetical protein
VHREKAKTAGPYLGRHLFRGSSRANSRRDPSLKGVARGRSNLGGLAMLSAIRTAPLRTVLINEAHSFRERIRHSDAVLIA